MELQKGNVLCKKLYFFFEINISLMSFPFQHKKTEFSSTYLYYKTDNCLLN